VTFEDTFRQRLGHAWTGKRLNVAEFVKRAAGVTRDAHPHRMLTPLVPIDDGLPAGRQPAVAPLREGDQRRDKVSTTRGEPVLGAIAAIPGGLVHHAGLNKVLQTGRQNVGRDAKAALEVDESHRSGEGGVAQDEEGPPFTEYLEGARDRTHLRVIRAT